MSLFRKKKKQLETEAQLFEVNVQAFFVKISNLLLVQKALTILFNWRKDKEQAYAVSCYGFAISLSHFSWEILHMRPRFEEMHLRELLYCEWACDTRGRTYEHTTKYRGISLEIFSCKYSSTSSKAGKFYKRNTHSKWQLAFEAFCQNMFMNCAPRYKRNACSFVKTTWDKSFTIAAAFRRGTFLWITG